MAGDEPRAKQLLLAMQERLARDPYEALGVTPSSQPADVRNAFLGLTKTYHPARFARMAVDVQKLANEVFLALRAAHDQLSRPSVNAAASSRRSGPIPVMPRPSTPPQTAPHTARTTTPPQPTSSGVPTPYAGAPTAQHAGAPTTSPARPDGRLPTAPLGMRPVQRFVPPASAITRPYGAPTTPPATTPSAPAPAPTTPSTPSTTPAAPRTTTPNLPAMSRTNTSRVVQQGRSPAPTPTPVATPASSPRMTPAAGVPAITSRTPTLDRELAPILELLTQGQFAASRLALETLAARSPAVPRYRALIAYAKGREAQLARRIDEARVELQEALQIDPTLELAKTALAELFTRRK